MLLAEFNSDTYKKIYIFPFFNEGGTQETVTTEVGTDATLL